MARVASSVMGFARPPTALSELGAGLRAGSRALVGAALVAACGVAASNDDDGGAVGHSPAAPKGEPHATFEAGSDASDGPAENAPIDSAEVGFDDGPQPESAPDAFSCPETTCMDGALVHSAAVGEQCSASSWQYCEHGCGLYGAVLACLPAELPGPCALNVSFDAGPCAYLVQTFCFDSFEAACQCAGCDSGSCVAKPMKKGGRLKFPPKLSDGSAEAATPADGDAAMDDANEPASADADGGDSSPDGGLVTMTIGCS